MADARTGAWVEVIDLTGVPVAEPVVDTTSLPSSPQLAPVPPPPPLRAHVAVAAAAPPHVPPLVRARPPPLAPPPPVPPALAARGPSVEARVFRQRHWIARQLAARSEPRPCSFNGSRKCPLCQQTFTIGQEMVKCYVEELGAPPWVHLDCVNVILYQRGAPGLRP